MKKQSYPELGETLYSQTLTNGLRVYLLPKAGYHKTYAVMTTDYGSVDQKFVPLGQSQSITQPAGIAHFLEHKMFEKADHDAFDTFAHYGASSNAFTSYTHTSYLFSATHHLKENLITLLDFVQSPYFTAKTVNKEKGIIGQEIQMYEDDPNSRAYFGTIANLYPNQPLANDIAGTLSSIDAITADDLYTAHRTFYHPSNMSLFVVGKLAVEETLDWIEANQSAKQFAPATAIQRITPTKTGQVTARKTLMTPIERPKVTIGLRGMDDLPTGLARLKYEDALSLGFTLLFGETSPEFLALYDRGVIDDSFGYNIELQRGAHHVILAGEAEDPEAFETAVNEILQHAIEKLQAASDRFVAVQREAIGSTLSAFNSLEAIANQFDDRLYGDANLFDEVGVIKDLTMADVIETTTQFIQASARSTQLILPALSD
ncbi:Zn-dependent peptidase [Secundilactobacillus odoratitofui DSM 19909 = JCM 15043]|uniref:Zn-dependent peptidase n=1 Tax=Secundilactobacillus odoratitofui DSM 19909 = JCM 15043 TaxID=1423776 RepID=A0A0R1LUD8_9LACO|nr:pitrilysin family protein [Secundilactobacillus odoratitofui]KRK99404.1 Zn-dependent peptidase [Secundilactobacillus odoratitofui DSM 19909 = JCM 15043]